MKCLNCGEKTDNFLCGACITEDILSVVFNNICYYCKDSYINSHVVEYVETFDNPKEARICIPEILELFDFSVAEFYICRYCNITRNEDFEKEALNFLGRHDVWDKRKQWVLSDLLGTYLRNDFVKPKEWCEFIKVTDNLYCELYYNAAQYFAMVGDYDLADEIINKALSYCNDNSYENFLVYPRETLITSFTKLSADNLRYRTKKPYWPSTEEKRKLLVPIYNEKGIVYPRVTLKPKKIPESAFLPINEAFDEIGSDYCAFWCSEAGSYAVAKDIYEIAAVRVRRGKIVDKFQSYICPWSGGIATKKSAANKANIDIEGIYSAKDVDQAMQNFFDFVKDDILVSTGALGQQAKLITRAARYSGMEKIENEFFDLLDYAAEISKEFDMKNNTREFLIKYFGLSEGKDSSERAIINVKIHQLLEKEKLLR